MKEQELNRNQLERTYGVKILAAQNVPDLERLCKLVTADAALPETRRTKLMQHAERKIDAFIEQDRDSY